MHQAANDPTKRSPYQRVVITGMGALTCVGHTVEETWEALKAGCSGIGLLTAIDPGPRSCRVAGELKGFDPAKFLSRKELRNMTLSSQLAVIAARQALEDAMLELDRENRDEIGVLLGTAGANSIEEAERAYAALLGQGSRRTSPFQVLRFWPNMPAFFVANENRLRGYNGTVCTACAAGTQAIGEASEVIRRGAAEVMVTGGTESMFSATVLTSFTAMHALPTSYDDEPERAMRPFDADREGFVPAQGSAILILESLAHAQARGAHIYAEILGFGTSNDAYHMIAPDPEGSGQALAVRRALASAGVSVDEVDYINAHGAATRLGDVAETKVIKSVYGKRAYEIPINSTKSMTGHTGGATGAIEAVACVKTIEEGIIHPTINYETPDPECDLDYVPNVARKADVKVAVSHSFGLGGQNAVLVFGAMGR